MLDTPPHSRHKNALPRDQLVSLLMEKVNAGEVNITLGEVNIIPSVRVPSTCSNIVQPTMTTVSVTAVSVITVSTTAVSMATSVIVSVPHPTASSMCNNVLEDSSGLASGAAAGLSIGVFVAGVFVGVISTVLTCWVMRSSVKSHKYSTSRAPYSKQRDDVVI